MSDSPLHNRNLHSKRSPRQNGDDADSRKTHDCYPAFWTSSVCIVGARRASTNRSFEHRTPRC